MRGSLRRLIVRKVKLFLVYFPIILIAGQLLANSIFYIDNAFYYKHAFYLSIWFGTNVLFAIFLCGLTWVFSFCSISKWCAAAQVFYAFNLHLFPRKEEYNVVFQIIVGVIALLITFSDYFKKFPLCKWSLLVKFYKDVAKERSCKKGAEKWDRDIKSQLKAKYRTNNARINSH
jgi:hypothetical protein